MEGHVLVQAEDTEIKVARFKRKKDEYDRNQQKVDEFSSKNKQFPFKKFKFMTNGFDQK